MQSKWISLSCTLLLICFSVKGQSIKKQKGNYNQKISYVVELNYINVTLNYENWDNDMAIMVR